MLKTLRGLALALTAALAFVSAPALALNLQPYTLQTFGSAYGAATALPGATVTVYLFGTSTKANLYAFSGGVCSVSAISNPMMADANGLASFCADSGSQYQANWSLGTFTSPTIYFATNLGLPLSANNVWTGTNSFANGLSWTGAAANSAAGAGTVEQLGSPGSAGNSTATPDAVDLGNDLSSTAGANPKLSVYHDSTGLKAGEGYSSDGVDFIITNATLANWHFWGGSNDFFDIFGPSIAAGYVKVNFSTNSSSASTGAVVVNGGVGVGGNVNVGGWITGNAVVRSQGAVWGNKFSVQTAAYTVDSGSFLDMGVVFNCTASCTITLPGASSYPGRRLRVVTRAAFTVVSASSNVVPLVGGAAGTAILAATAGKWAELESDGSNWNILAGN